MNLYVSIEYDREQIVIFFIDFGNSEIGQKIDGKTEIEEKNDGNSEMITPPAHPPCRELNVVSGSHVNRGGTYQQKIE